PPTHWAETAERWPRQARTQMRKLETYLRPERRRSIANKINPRAAKTCSDRGYVMGRFGDRRMWSLVVESSHRYVGCDERWNGRLSQCRHSNHRASVTVLDREGCLLRGIRRIVRSADIRLHGNGRDGPAKMMNAMGKTDGQEGDGANNRNSPA